MSKPTHQLILTEKFGLTCGQKSIQMVIFGQEVTEIDHIVVDDDQFDHFL